MSGGPPDVCCLSVFYSNTSGDIYDEEVTGTMMGDDAQIFANALAPAVNIRNYHYNSWHNPMFNLPLQSSSQHEGIFTVSNGSDYSSSTNSRDSQLMPMNPSESDESSVGASSDSTSSGPVDSTSFTCFIGDSTKDSRGKRSKRRLADKVLRLLMLVIAFGGIAAAIAVAVLFTTDEVQTFSAIVRVNETFNDSMAYNDSDTFQSFGDRFCFNVVSFLAGNFDEMRCQVNSLSPGSVIVHFTLEVLATTNISETQRHLTEIFNVSQVGVMPIYTEDSSFSCPQNSTQSGFKLPPVKASDCSSDSGLPILPLSYTFPHHCGEYQVCLHRKFVLKTCPKEQEFAYLSSDNVLICASPPNVTTHCERERQKQQTTTATSTVRSTTTSSVQATTSITSSASVTRDDDTTNSTSSAGQSLTSPTTLPSSSGQGSLTTVATNVPSAAQSTSSSSPEEGDSTYGTSFTSTTTESSTPSTPLSSLPWKGSSTYVATSMPSPASTTTATEKDKTTRVTSFTPTTGQSLTPATTSVSPTGHINSTYTTTSMSSIASSTLEKSSTASTTMSSSSGQSLTTSSGQSNSTYITTSMSSSTASSTTTEKDSSTRVTSLTSTTGQSLTPGTTSVSPTGHVNSTYTTTSMPSIASSTLEKFSTSSTTSPSLPVQGNSSFAVTSASSLASSTALASSTRLDNSSPSTSTLKQPTTVSTSSTQMLTSLAPTITGNTLDNNASSSLSTTTTSPATTEWKPVYTCPSTGYAYLPAHDTYPNNCTKHQWCEHGVPKIMTCAPGTDFVYSNIPSVQVACDYPYSPSTFCNKMKALSTTVTSIHQDGQVTSRRVPSAGTDR